MYTIVSDSFRPQDHVGVTDLFKVIRLAFATNGYMGLYPNSILKTIPLIVKGKHPLFKEK